MALSLPDGPLKQLKMRLSPFSVVHDLPAEDRQEGPVPVVTGGWYYAAGTTSLRQGDRAS